MTYKTSIFLLFGDILQRTYLFMSPEIELSMSQNVVSHGRYQCPNLCAQYADSLPPELGSWLRHTQGLDRSQDLTGQWLKQTQAKVCILRQ